MTGPTKKHHTVHHERKTKSGLSSLKKKLSFPRIYKRLASKLSIHGRHIRSLTSTWNASDLQCMVAQYELTSMLKELSDAAELARPIASSVSEDLLRIQKESYLCDLCVYHGIEKRTNSSNVYQPDIKVHSVLFSKRTCILLPPVKTIGRNLLKPRCKVDADVVELLPEPYGVLENLPIQFSFLYDKAAHKLTFYAKETLPDLFLENLLCHIYGQKPLIMQNVDAANAEQNHLVTSHADEIIKDNGKSEDKSTDQLDVLSHTPVDKNAKLPTSQLASNNFNTDKRTIENKFVEEFRNDMKDLLLSANVTGDVKLVFAVSSLLSVVSSHLRSRQPGLCCHCHSFVLAARSKFFRNVIQRLRERGDSTDDKPSPFMTIELDWKVFSPRYFSVVLHAVYTDEVDLQRITKSVPLISHRVAMESLSAEVRDLMELSYIGHFLDFASLIQGCGNALIDKLNVSNFIEMLQWSSQPHGSQWLRRQIIRYARENFLQLLAHAVLFSLSSSELAEIIQSDFVNASELEILRAVLKWGEHELLRRIELREPNLVRSHVLLNQATRNFRVSSTRRRELLMAGNTEELHEITAALLSHVRLRHVLPANHEVLASAIKRGVISCPPEHLLEWHHHSGSTNDNENEFFWLRCRAGLGFCPPRLFMPYCSEAKAILEERLSQESTGNVNLKSVKRSLQTTISETSVAPSSVPDALYMVNQIHHSSRTSSSRAPSCELCRHSTAGVTSLATRRLKYIDNRYPVPTAALGSKLLARERQLRQTAWIRRILNACHSASMTIPHCCCISKRNSMTEMGGNVQTGLLCNLCRAEGYIRLLAVREHNLPDVSSDVLKRPHLYYDPDELCALPSDDTKSNPVIVKTTTNNPLIAAAPKRLQKLFHKKASTLSKQLASIPDTKPTWQSVNSSSSDLSLSDDSGTEWPFPYRDLHVRGRNQPGSSFWGSDSSIQTPTRQCGVPDVAASADSTLKRFHSRLSCSSSDSCASVPCRLVAESRCQDPDQNILEENIEESENKSDLSSTTFTRRTFGSSYAHYLSMRRPKRRSNDAVATDSLSSTTSDATSLAVHNNSPATRTASSMSNSFPNLVLEGLPSESSPAAIQPPDICIKSSCQQYDSKSTIPRVSAGNVPATTHCDFTTTTDDTLDDKRSSL